MLESSESNNHPLPFLSWGWGQGGGPGGGGDAGGPDQCGRREGVV